MKSDSQRSIDRARAGEPGSSTPRRLTRRPHLEAVCPRREDGHKLPLIASLGTNGTRDFAWIQRSSRSDGRVHVFANEHDTEPQFIIAQRPGDASVWTVTTRDGQNIATVFDEGSRGRGKWSVNTADAANRYKLDETRGDAMWRRTIARISRIDNPALEWLGVILFVLLLPALLKPPLRLSIRDNAGKDVGFVTYPSTALKPRENFSLYLTHEPFPLTNSTLALAVVALMQALR